MKNNYPKVSVITINFNGKKYLKKLFDSLLKLNYPKNKLEVIFVDNISTDGSVEFVKKNYPKVRIIKNDINNYCKAVNLGIGVSKAKYLALVNNDIKVDKSWLIELIEVIVKDKNIAAVGSKILNIQRKVQNAAHYELPNFYWGERGAGQKTKRYNSIEEVSSLCGAAVLYRKDFLFAVGLFDEDFVIYGEDVDMSLRLRQKGYKLVFVPTSIVYHKFHGTANEELARYYIERNRLLFLAKHYPHKLSSSLLGSGYFTAKKSTDSSGKIYSIFPDIVLKLIKIHSLDIAKEIVSELFGEIKKIVNYDNDVLAQEINKITEDRNTTYARLNNTHKELQEKANENNKKDKELSLLKDKLIGFSNQLQSRIDEFSQKLKIISDKEKEVSYLKEELGKIEEQLSSRMDEALLKDGEIIEKDNQIAQLSEQIQQHLGLLSEREEFITNLKGELNNLSNQLRQRMDEVLLKDGQIIEKDNQFAQLKGELNGVYNSEGFRFVLRPLWTAIWHVRKSPRVIKRKLSQIFWLAITLILTPVFLLLSLSFLLEYISWFILRPIVKRIAPKRKIKSIKDKKISIVIPNYNGINYLKECLPSIFSVEEFGDGQNQVLVVDDGSTDESVGFIKTYFPQVHLIQNRKNKGFGFTCNRGIKCAKNEIIVLLNNDIILTKDFLRPLISDLQEEDVFVATPKLYAWDKKTFVWGMHMGYFEEGYIKLWNESDTANGDKVSQTSPSIFAIGGAMVFRRSDFLWLGGFDSIYRPNCWEDIDLSYRAWKRGLKVLYEPKSLIYHKGRATLTYERPKEIKNELLFTWKNITDTEIINSHLNLLPWNLYRNRMNFLKGFFWALDYLPQALLHRFLNRRYTKIQDKKIFNQCTLYYQNFMRRGFRHLQGNDKKNILLITPFMPYPLNSGGKIRIHTLAKLLTTRYNIILLTLIDHKDELNYITELKTIFKEVYPIYPRSPIPGKIYPSLYRNAYSLELIEKFKEIQKEYPLDLVQIESNELLYLAHYVQYVPIIYTEHDTSIFFFRKSYYRQEHKLFILNFYDYLRRVYFHNSIYKKLDKVIVLSKKDEEVLRTFCPLTDTSFVPTGVDLEHFQFNYHGNKSKSLIFIGHYPHYPNEDAVIYFTNYIFPLIRSKEPRVEFLIVGSKPTERIKNLANQPNIKLIGDVKDVWPYLKEAAVFVNPVRISAGIKGKVLEAMATGVPVVTTEAESFGINAKAGKEILTASFPSEFANQVIRLLADDNLHLQIAKKARLLVERKYDWHKISKLLDRVYEESMGSLNFYPKEKHEAVSLDKVLERTKSITEEAIEEKEFLTGSEHGPQELHIELTYRCNSQCLMCDLWDYQKRVPDKRGELGLDEIRRFVEESEYLRKTKIVVLSGGEPFLRNDIIDICGFFTKYFPQSSIGILTNGLDTSKIIKNTIKILDKYRPNYLWLGSSLDGIDQAHDYMRGHKGAFQSLKKTISACRKNNINICLTFTLTPYNLEQLIPAKRFADNQGVNFYIQFAVPKEARDRSIFTWTSSQLAEVEAKLYEMMEDSIGHKDYQTLLDDIEENNHNGATANLYYLSHLVNYQRAPQRFFKKCVAGTRFAMLTPYGDLFFCPKLKNGVIGSLKENKFDELWTSKKAENTRDFINQGFCHCWLVCTVLPVVGEALAGRNSRQARAILDDN